MARGAKSRANLKVGNPGKRRPKDQATADAARRIAKRLLNDPAYRKGLIGRLRRGTVQPGVEALLWYYAHGKPKETVESMPSGDIRIVHQYAEKPKPDKVAPPRSWKKVRAEILGSLEPKT